MSMQKVSGVFRSGTGLISSCLGYFRRKVSVIWAPIQLPIPCKNSILNNFFKPGIVRKNITVLGWRNRQTQWTQNPPLATACEFDSRSEHQEKQGHQHSLKHDPPPFLLCQFVKKYNNFSFIATTRFFRCFGRSF